LLARLEAEDLLCAPVRDMREVLSIRRRAQRDGHGRPAAGGTRYRSSPAQYESAAPVTITRVPPHLGEHTDEVSPKQRRRDEGRS